MVIDGNAVNSLLVKASSDRLSLDDYFLAARSTSDCSELRFSDEPIGQLIAGEAVTLKIDFISAAADLFVSRRVVFRTSFCMRLAGVCGELQSLI
jgi:hypothetical protein